MKLLDGKLLSQKILQNISIETKRLNEKYSLVPGLAVLLIGEDPASEIYVRNKISACEKVGFHSVLQKLPASISKAELKKEIESLNVDPTIHGILIQLPLPSHLDQTEALSCLDPTKDVDGLSLENRAFLWSGFPRVVPCTPKGIITLLKSYEMSIEGKKAVVIGRSQIVGLPMFQQLLSQNATVTLCHSRTKNLSDICREADIVVACAGKKALIGKEDLKRGAIVVDVGIHREKSKLCGDVRKEGLENHLLALTPVPGGVGPMTIASLIENCFHLARLKL